MDALRWILLVIAAVIIVAIYFFSRTRSKQHTASPLDAVNDVPSFSAVETAGKAPNKAPNNEWTDGVGPVRVMSQDEAAQQSTNQNKAKVSETNAPDWDSLFDAEKENTKQPGFDEEKLENLSQAEDELEVTYDPMEESHELELDSSTDDLDPPSSIETQATSQDLQETSHQDSGLGESTRDELSVNDSDQDDSAIDDVISVYVLASEEEPHIKGEKILSASYALQLEHGEMNIFHRHDEQPPHEILFSMANVLNPGWFEFEKMNELQTRGMSFFMQVNLVDQPSHVLDDMLICAHQMATMLGAVLCNPQRQPLDEAYTNYLRDKVKHLEKLKAQSM